MQYRFQRLFISTLVLMLVFTFTGVNVFAQDATTEAQVRFLHVVPGASAIDIYTDGQLSISNLEYGTASTYVRMSAGTHQIVVTQTGTKTPLWQQEIDPAAGMAYTLVAASIDSLVFRVYQDDLNFLPLGKARFTAIHAVAGGTAVDIILPDGRPIISNLTYEQEYGTLDVPTFAYEMAVTSTGDTIENALVSTEAIGPVALNSGTSYTFVVYGSAPQVQALILSAPTMADVDSGYVRLAHGVAEAPAVDVYINDTLVAPSLSFGQSTQFMALPVGDYTAALRAAGTDSDVLATDVSISSDVWSTAVALGTLENITLDLFPSDISAITADQSVLNVINGIPGESTVSVALGDGTAIIDGVATGESGASIIEPGEEIGTASISIDGEITEAELPIGDFYGGVFYEYLAAGESEFFAFSPVSFAQSSASAPIESTLTVAMAETPEQTTEAQDVAQSEVVLSTPTPGSEVPVQATTDTQALSEVVTEEPTLVAAPVSTTPTGRVVLNPGANIQLRQYPTSSALSLGLAPSGATLTINGRAGEAIAIPESATQIAPGATPFVDPASLLTDDRSDLNPADTWLNVTYDTPDGGQIQAWVNALYIDVRDSAGNRQRLANLATVPSNLPGETRDTAVTPPPARQDRVNVIVGNLDEGVNLHIRRTTDVTSESLALVSSGTVMEFEGISDDSKWVFVRYNTPEGTTVTGWVDALYISYSFNGSPLSLPLMEERNLMTIAPIDRLGEVTISTVADSTTDTTVVQPQITSDPLRDAIVAEVLLDTGANLHLRRNADVNAESLALLPDGTRLEVNSRTGSGEWLEATFEDQVGWVSSRFVALTLNGRPFRLVDVPLAEGEIDTASTLVTPLPGATPGVPVVATLAATIEPTTPRTPVIVTGDLIDMTVSPGGASLGLPLLHRGEEVNLVFYSQDGFFALVERIDIPNAPPGWVPAVSIKPK